MTELWRLSGAGNDFLAVVPPAAPPGEDLVRSWCRRGISLGADGVLFLEPGDPTRLYYWNADGSPADLCLNGARCAAQLAVQLGWAEDSLTLGTGAGELRAHRVSPSEVEVEIPIRPQNLRSVEVDLEAQLEDRPIRGWLVEVGVPHLVIPWESDLAECPVSRLGPPLRSHPVLGPLGANVDFVRYPDEQTLEIRSYERGVEAETLACGTGVLAAAAVGIRTGRVELPVTAHTRGGFDLEVAGKIEEGSICGWSLGGDARVLAKLTVCEGAELPETARPSSEPF